MGKWRRHSREFKQAAVERLKTAANVHELARELGVERKLLYTWKYQFEGRPEPKHANYLGYAAPSPSSPPPVCSSKASPRSTPWPSASAPKTSSSCAPPYPA